MTVTPTALPAVVTAKGSMIALRDQLRYPAKGSMTVLRERLRCAVLMMTALVRYLSVIGPFQVQALQGHEAPLATDCVTHRLRYCISFYLVGSCYGDLQGQIMTMSALP